MAAVAALLRAGTASLRAIHPAAVSGRLLCTSAVARAAAPSTAAAPLAIAVDMGAERSSRVATSVDAKIANTFYDPAVRVSKRQRQVFASLADEPPLPLMEDHGLLYRTSGEELAGSNEMVKRALSTRTGNIQQVLAFKKSEILRKYAPKLFDTGASRVQVAMLTERINRLAAHSTRNKHDKNCKRSLTALTVRRRKLLEYMMRTDYQNYRLMVRELDLRALPLFHSRHLPKVREETHTQVKERHARLKNRVSRGHKGH